MIKKYAIEIKWALIFVVAVLIWMFLEKTAGLHDKYIDKHPTYTFLFTIPSILIYYLALKERREKIFAGKITWKKSFFAITPVMTLFIGAITSAVVALIVKRKSLKRTIQH